MVTKLKNNKKAVQTALVIVAVAAVIFVLTAIGYKGDVDAYCAENSGGYESENFIKILFQNNYVLYPEVLEKGGKQNKVEDLYLLFEEQTAEQAIYYGNETPSDRSAERLKADHVMSVQQQIQQIKELYTAELGTRMDYCVIDEETQTILKNTTRNWSGCRRARSGTTNIILFSAMTRTEALSISRFTVKMKINF